MIIADSFIHIDDIAEAAAEFPSLSDISVVTLESFPASKVHFLAYNAERNSWIPVGPNTEVYDECGTILLKTNDQGEGIIGSVRARAYRGLGPTGTRPMPVQAL